MAHISVHVSLDQFSIVQDNEGSLDEPYIWPIFIRLDGRILNEPQGSAVLPMFAPKTGHGNIHHVNDRVADAISFTWESDLEPGGMAVNPAIWRAGCFVIVAIAFLEQDASTDSDALASHDAAMAELQKQGNKALQKALVLMNYPSNLTIDEDAMKLAIMLRMFPKKFGETLAEGFLPFASIVLNFINIASLADPDDYVGEGYSDKYHLGKLIGYNPHGFDFQIDSDNQGAGKYRVNGTIRRSDTDEVPILAVTRSGGNNLRLYTRSIEDNFTLFTSADFGQSFTDNGRFTAGSFLSGPGACSSPNGIHQHLVGMGLDNHFWIAGQNHPKAGFSGLRQLADGVFKSAPAVCATADGKWVHIIGRGTDDRYWHGFSNDSGATVQGWWPIGEGTFRSTPAAVITPDGSRLMVFGLGLDNNLWWAFSHDHGGTWDMAWDLLPDPKNPSVANPTDKFTSAPGGDHQR